MNKTGRTSEALTPQEFKDFKKWVNTFFTKAEAADTVGISYPTFDRILAVRRGSPITIAKIRKAINQIPA